MGIAPPWLLSRSAGTASKDEQVLLNLRFGSSASRLPGHQLPAAVYGALISDLTSAAISNSRPSFRTRAELVIQDDVHPDVAFPPELGALVLHKHPGARAEAE